VYSFLTYTAFTSLSVVLSALVSLLTNEFDGKLAIRVIIFQVTQTLFPRYISVPLLCVLCALLGQAVPEMTYCVLSERLNLYSLIASPRRPSMIMYAWLANKDV